MVLDQYFVDQGGESIEEVLTRFSQALHKIMEEDKNDTILAVGHGVANYIFFSSVENPKEIKYSRANCSIIKLKYDNGKFIIEDMIDPLND